MTFLSLSLTVIVKSSRFVWAPRHLTCFALFRVKLAVLCAAEGSLGRTGLIEEVELIIWRGIVSSSSESLNWKSLSLPST